MIIPEQRILLRLEAGSDGLVPIYGYVGQVIERTRPVERGNGKNSEAPII